MKRILLVLPGVLALLGAAPAVAGGHEEVDRPGRGEEQRQEAVREQQRAEEQAREARRYEEELEAKARQGSQERSRNTGGRRTR